MLQSPIKAPTGTSIPRKISFFIQPGIISYQNDNYFPKNCEIERPCCEAVKKVQKLCDSQQNHEIESLQVCMCPQKSNWVAFHPGQGRIHPNVNAGAKCTLKF